MACGGRQQRLMRLNIRIVDFISIGLIFNYFTIELVRMNPIVRKVSAIIGTGSNGFGKGQTKNELGIPK